MTEAERYFHSSVTSQSLAPALSKNRECSCVVEAFEVICGLGDLGSCKFPRMLHESESVRASESSVTSRKAVWFDHHLLGKPGLIVVKRTGPIQLLKVCCVILSK